MTRKLKMLGMALIAVLALTAVVASAASAAQYTAASYPTTGTGTSAAGIDTFITEGGTVECASHYEGTLANASKTLTVTPKYTSCKAFGFLSAEVKMNGCDYLFNEPVASGSDFLATVDVQCTTNSIEVIASTCKVTIGAQKGLKNVTITNLGTEDVAVKAGIKGIAYTVTQDGLGCPFNGTGVKAGGEYIQDKEMTFDSTNGVKIDVG